MSFLPLPRPQSPNPKPENSQLMKKQSSKRRPRRGDRRESAGGFNCEGAAEY